MQVISLRRISNRFGNFRFLSCIIGQSDVMSLSLHDDGNIRFSRAPGVISRPQGEDFKAMLEKVKTLA